MSVHYREILKTQLRARQLRNSRYSLSAFARDLGLAAPRLSQVLNGKEGLSPKRAATLSKKLSLSDSERKVFLASVAQNHSRSKNERLKSKKQIEQLTSKDRAVSLDVFRLIADWPHFALLELLLMKSVEPKVNALAIRLGLTNELVGSCLERLERLGFVSRDAANCYSASTESSRTPDDIPSDAVKQFHDGVFQLARKALYFQAVEDREMLTSFLAIKKQDLPKAKQRIREFRDQFAAEFGVGQDADGLYCLGLQCFELRDS